MKNIDQSAPQRKDLLKYKMTHNGNIYAYKKDNLPAQEMIITNPENVSPSVTVRWCPKIWIREK